MGVALASIGIWWLFEWYNAPRFWRGGADLAGLWWQYHGLEPDPFLRRVGYDWAFATILPALFLTATVLRASVFRGLRVRPWRPRRGLLRLSVATGAVCVALPLLVVSPWLVPLVWLGWALLLEPLNARAGRPSWLADLARGDASRLAALLASGAVCGVLWEFWNYWATARWTYTVPYLGGVKLFEMPVLGYLGFPPFALECYAMYHALRGVLVAGDEGRGGAADIIAPHAAAPFTEGGLPMKAVRVHTPGGPEALRYEDVAEPTAKPGHAVVKVDAAGLNYIDVYYRSGLYKAELPMTLGMEAGGTVTAVGPNVTQVKVGDKVAYTGVPGSYAEYALVPADRLVVLPAGLSTKHGAAAMLQGMTAHYLACSTWPLRSGEACLVHAAAGGVGLLLCQIAKMRGARVIGTVSTEDKAKLAREAGADEVILYTPAGLRGRGQAPHGWEGTSGRVRLRRQGHVRAGIRLPGPPRDDGPVRAVERPRRALRRREARRGRLALPDPAESRRLHGDPGRAGAAGRRRAGLDSRRQADDAHGVRVRAQGRGRGPPRPGGTAHDRQGAARSLKPGRDDIAVRDSRRRTS